MPCKTTPNLIFWTVAQTGRVTPLVSGPPGMGIDSNTGLVTLQIRKELAGTHRVEISVEDLQGLKASQVYSLTLAVP